MRLLLELLDEALADHSTAAAFWIICIVLAVAAAFAFACSGILAGGRL